MIRLHMMDDQIIRLPVAQSLRQIGLPFLPFTGINGIQDSDLVAAVQQIGVIGHAFRHNILTFKKIEVVVLHTDVAQTGFDFANHDEMDLSLTKIIKMSDSAPSDPPEGNTKGKICSIWKLFTTFADVLITIPIWLKESNRKEYRLPY